MKLAIVDDDKQIREQILNQACVWWFNQPKVPESMKKEKIICVKKEED